MRTLIVMRHAKAERGEGKADFDRALEPRGRSDAERVAEQLVAARLEPDVVLCSASHRTRETLAVMLPHFSLDCTVQLRAALYEAETGDLRDALRTAQGQRVLLIGHNPAVHGVAMALAGPRAEELARGFPTSTAAVFSMGFALDTVKLDQVISP